MTPDHAALAREILDKNRYKKDGPRVRVHYEPLIEQIAAALAAAHAAGVAQERELAARVVLTEACADLECRRADCKMVRRMVRKIAAAIRAGEEAGA